MKPPRLPFGDDAGRRVRQFATVVVAVMVAAASAVLAFATVRIAGDERHVAPLRSPTTAVLPVEVLPTVPPAIDVIHSAPDEEKADTVPHGG